MPSYKTVRLQKNKGLPDTVPPEFVISTADSSVVRLQTDCSSSSGSQYYKIRYRHIAAVVFGISKRNLLHLSF